MAKQEIGDDALDEATIFQIRLDLKGVRPPVWRRLLLHSDTRLDELHHLIQVAMGWTNSHLHMFNGAGMDIGDVSAAEWDIDSLDERDFLLSDVLARVGAKLQYEYDFGDGWQHVLKLEKILPVDPDGVYPACIGGKRACPLEDVGGFAGYAGFLEAYADPAHPEHGEFTEWVGEGFDPEYFDAQETTEALQAVWDELAEDTDILVPITSVRFQMITPEMSDMMLLIQSADLDDRSESRSLASHIRAVRKTSSVMAAIPIDYPHLMPTWLARVVGLGSKMIPALVQRLAEPDALEQSQHAWLQGQIAVALQRLGPASAPPLIEAFDRLDGSGKAVACLVLGQLGVHEAADRIWRYFEEALEEALEWRVLGPMWALVDLGDPRAADAVAWALERGWYATEIAVMAGRVGDRRALQPLLSEALNYPKSIESYPIAASMLIASRLGRETLIEVVACFYPPTGDEAPQSTPEEFADALLSLPVDIAETRMVRFFEPMTLQDMLDLVADMGPGGLDYSDDLPDPGDPNDFWLDDLWLDGLDDDIEAFPSEDASDSEAEEEAPFAVISPRLTIRPPYTRPGRNDPCWCGSGRKYKDCHWREDQQRDMPQAA